MFATERQKLILDEIKRNLRVKVAHLVEITGASESTIRRDLQELEESGLIQRTHGGAILSGKSSFEPTMGEKYEVMQDEKEFIAKLAVDKIKDNDTIFLDSGTTTLKIAERIDGKNLTVLTNSMPIAQVLSKKENINLTLAGGQLRWQTDALVGPVTEEFIRKFRVDKVFLGANGLSIQEGITTPNVIEAYTKRAMIEIAKEIIVVADHSKFDTSYFASISPIENVDYIISDFNISNETVKKYNEAGITIIHR